MSRGGHPFKEACLADRIVALSIDDEPKTCADTSAVAAQTPLYSHPTPDFAALPKCSDCGKVSVITDQGEGRKANWGRGKCRSITKDDIASYSQRRTVEPGDHPVLRFCRRFCTAGLFAITLGSSLPFASTAFASPPSEEVFPSGTKAYVSIPSYKALRENFSQTNWGELCDDPAMKPFVDSMAGQLRARLQDTGLRLGLKIADLESVAGDGEIALAFIQPSTKEAGLHATALLVDITGRQAEALAVIEKTTETLKSRGAKRTTQTIDGVEMSIFTIERKDKTVASRVFQFHAEDALVATDNETIARDLLARIKGNRENNLANLPAYAAVRSNVDGDQVSSTTHVKWFVDPFGYAQLAKAMQATTKRKRGQDLTKIMKDQGFTVISGVGGNVSFATDAHEILHETYVHAPGSPAQRFKLAAQMLQFPNTAEHDPKDWVANDVSSYMSINLDIQNAFKHLNGIVDGYIGEPGAFESVLDGLAQDPSGPRVDLRKELVPYLGNRVALVSDYRLPINTKSERVLVAIDINNDDAVKKTLARIMRTEPDAKKLVVNGHDLWEMARKEALADDTEVEVTGKTYVAKTGASTEAAEPAHEGPVRIPRSAFAVADGKLLIATHADFLSEVIRKQHEQNLDTAADFQRLTEAVNSLGGGESSFRYFTRTSESYRHTYELLRQNKMTESESMLSWILNRVLAGPKGSPPRKQLFDGKDLPEFTEIAKYLGPAGFRIDTLPQGWRMSGCLLKPAGDAPPVIEDTATQTAKATEGTTR
jgi:hypothetical protein